MQSSDPSQSLRGRDGRRKYLTPAERVRFIAAALAVPCPKVSALCLVLAHSGCRISEALALTRYSLEPEEALIAIQSLKKRKDGVMREIPIPPDLMVRLQALVPAYGTGRLWTYSRGRAWQLVKAVMQTAQIVPGPHACPKGLRHGYGVQAIRCGVPLHLLQRWLGHASLSTTAIYTQVIGEEEREIAQRMWR